MARQSAASDRRDGSPEQQRRPPATAGGARASDGLPLCLHEFGTGGRPVLIGHPMGYHALVMAPLARGLPGMHSYVPDLRGHGGTAVAPGYRFSGECLAYDVLGCLEWISAGGQGIVGVGHSLGAAALVLAEAMRPGSFQGLYLYEPAIIPPRAADRLTLENPRLAGMLRRRRSFSSRSEAYARYATKAPLCQFADDALAQYVEHGFVDEADGSVRLACLPEFEVGISLSGTATLAFERLSEVRCPVLVARGTATGNAGRAGFEEEVTGALPLAELERLDALTHFGPQQQPDVVARSVTDFITRIDEASTCRGR